MHLLRLRKVRRASGPCRIPSVYRDRWILHRRSVSCLQCAPHRIGLQYRNNVGRDSHRAAPVPTGSQRDNRFFRTIGDGNAFACRSIVRSGRRSVTPSRFPRLSRAKFETGAPVFPGMEVVTKNQVVRGKLFLAWPGDVNECAMSAITLYRSRVAPSMNSDKPVECDAVRFVRQKLAADRWAFTESVLEPGHAASRG